jgi:HSP20 family protein
MSLLIKTPVMPTLRSITEDFWNVENLFDYPFIRKETLPAVNIKENDNHFEIEVAAPGFQKKDFKIDVQNGVLNISAETSNKTAQTEENYTRKEFSYAAFNRSFNLPENINEDAVNAKYENGLLFLSIKKAENKQLEKKQIPID